MKILSALAWLAAAASAFAQDSDPLKSPACGQALAGLQAARAADPRAAGLPAMRDQAALACLGAAPAAGGRSARVLQPPVVVPPPAITPPAMPEPLAAPRLPPPPVAIARPPVPSHCDAGGCWSNDAGGLRHVGPNLAAPNGLCSRQGALVYCP